MSKVDLSPEDLTDRRPLGAGRAPAGRALLDWATRQEGPRLCLIAGARGTGKSHLLAWLVAHGAEHPAARVHALVPAADRSPSPVLWELSHQLGWAARTVPELLARLDADRRPLLIGIADLHRASAGERRTGLRLVPDLLEPLLQRPWVRLVVEVGPLAANPFTAEATVVDLDDERLTDRAAFAAWYAGLPGAEHAPPPTVVPPLPVLGRLAAQLPAGAIAGRDGTAATVVDAWWERQGPDVRRALGTLGRLGWPVDLPTWRAVHATLHPEVPDAAAEAETAAGRLTWTGDGRTTGPHWLPLPALAAPAERGAPGGDFFAALLGLVPRNDRDILEWDRAPDFVRDHLTDHARTDEQVMRLLSDPGFLVHGSVAAICRLLDRPGVRVPRSLRSAWRAAAPLLTHAGRDEAERAAILHAAALGPAPRLAALLAPAAERHPVAARWTRMRRTVTVASGPAKGERWPGAVRALALGAPSPSEPPWLLAADPLGQLRRLTLDTGRTLGRIINETRAAVSGLARLDGGTWAVLTNAGSVRLVPGGDQPPPSLRHAPGADRAPLTCLGGDPGGGLLVLGDDTGTAWLHTHDNSGLAPAGSARLAEAPLRAVCGVRLGNGRTMVLGATADGRVVLWGPPRSPSSVPLLVRAAVPTALAAAPVPGGAVCAVAWSDGLIDVLSPHDGGELSFRSHHPVAALAIASDGLIVGAGDEAVTAWRCDLSRLPAN
ncbi:hypothetical protein FH609_024775 [Streptomyces sp. 3MP-14]|uniref:WD40 repeat domain-containing protein n=1 Tax=Streptomyces mimosae TaxID=2586635 RepID=A0A5N6A139_9ACTN|nr:MULTISPECIES: hypothetical protein [Streptomyces]KAB8162165.1 hypothetical protein FH607_021960 [Streptomyces mimosae]KAB8173937.1 hypothetical protein FH609_024775 [Streptomyces sp. 3MP-14]